MQIDLYSDTASKPTPGMRRANAEAITHLAVARADVERAVAVLASPSRS